MITTNQIGLVINGTNQSNRGGNDINQAKNSFYNLRGNSAHKHIPEEQFTSKVLNSQTGKHVHRQTAKIAESRTDSGTD